MMYNHRSAQAICQSIGMIGVVEAKHTGVLSRVAFESLQRRVLRDPMVRQAACVVLRYDTALLAMNLALPLSVRDPDASAAHLIYVVPMHTQAQANEHIAKLWSQGVSAQALCCSPRLIALAYQLADLMAQAWMAPLALVVRPARRRAPARYLSRQPESAE